MIPSCNVIRHPGPRYPFLVQSPIAKLSTGAFRALVKVLATQLARVQWRTHLSLLGTFQVLKLNYVSRPSSILNKLGQLVTLWCGWNCSLWSPGRTDRVTDIFSMSVVGRVWGNQHFLPTDGESENCYDLPGGKSGYMWKVKNMYILRLRSPSVISQPRMQKFMSKAIHWIINCKSKIMEVA